MGMLWCDPIEDRLHQGVFVTLAKNVGDGTGLRVKLLVGGAVDRLDIDPGNLLGGQPVPHLGSGLSGKVNRQERTSCEGAACDLEGRPTRDAGGLAGTGGGQEYHRPSRRSA